MVLDFDHLKEWSPSKQEWFPINDLTDFFESPTKFASKDFRIFYFVWIVGWHIKSCQTKNWSQVDHKKNSPSYLLMDSYLLKGINF